MKHLSVRISAAPELDAKGYLVKVIDDRNGSALTLSDADSSYWMQRMKEFSVEAMEWAVTSPQPGHVIKSHNMGCMEVARRKGDMLTLKKGLVNKGFINVDDILLTEIEPTEEYEAGILVPMWNLDEFDLTPCSCGALVPVASRTDETDAKCWWCFDE
ncbi:hypothetical protein LCGC14_2196310 [marine sediment metagenome]|uniref:Uncharacterized protein n=1 Tax=marine sediment metagenome TaxID=412755 RepID=A0A0F9DI81_9ZZZZ